MCVGVISAVPAQLEKEIDQKFSIILQIFSKNDLALGLVRRFEDEM